MGYHIKHIQKGVLGEISKIREELEELEDAIEQNNRIMALIELSDLIGAIEAYLEKEFTDFILTDLLTMKTATQKAFRTGDRT